MESGWPTLKTKTVVAALNDIRSDMVDNRMVGSVSVQTQSILLPRGKLWWSQIVRRKWRFKILD